MSRPALLQPLSMALMAVGLAGFALTPAQPVLLFGVFVLTLLVVSATGWSISNRPGPDALDVRLMDAALISLTFMVLSVLLLGSFGLLGWWMLVASAGMAGATWAMLDRRTGFERRELPVRRLQVGGVTALAAGLASFAAVQAILGRIYRPPVGDPLAYHLPFAVEWLQRGSLMMLAPAAGDPSPPFYPLNSSAWIFWLLAPFESEILARFVQLPFLGLLALATYRLGRELRLSSPAAAMTAALAVSVPSIARSASLPENDLILAALFVTVTAYLLALAGRFSVWRAAMTAVVIGLAIGTKVIALALGGILGAVWLALVIRARRPAGIGPASRLLAIGAVVVLLTGGYSFVRNAIVMGNPLYPAGYDLPGGYVLDGLYFPTWEWRQEHAFFAFDWRAFLFESRRDFGWTVTAWVIPGVILATLLSGVEAIARRRIPAGVVPVLWVAASLLIFWYIIPYHFSRFLFATIVLATVSGMWGLGRLAAGSRSDIIADWYPVLAVPVIAVNLINVPLDPAIRDRPVYWIAAFIVIGGTAGFLLVARMLPLQRLRLIGQVGAIATALVLTVAWPFYSDTYDDRRMNEWRAQIQGFSQTPEAWAWLESETAGEQSVVAVAGTNEIYPLYGLDLENRVVTIWHSGELAEYGWGAPFIFYGEPRRLVWEEQVLASGVDYIVITENVSFGGFPVERDWMFDAPDRFRLAFSNDDIEIWEVTGIPAETARYTDRQGWQKQSDWQVD